MMPNGYSKLKVYQNYSIFLRYQNFKRDFLKTDFFKSAIQAILTIFNRMTRIFFSIKDYLIILWST